MLPDEAKDVAGSEAVDPLTDWQVQDIGGSQLEVSSASRHERRCGCIEIAHLGRGNPSKSNARADWHIDFMSSNEFVSRFHSSDHCKAGMKPGPSGRSGRRRRNPDQSLPEPTFVG